MPSKTHGKSQTPIYQVWQMMKQRCFNKRNRNYIHYGGRGITVCRRWLKFENFCADMGKRPAGKSLERKNNNGNYTPKNCRWATQLEQCRNMRTTTIIKAHGETKTLTEWSENLGTIKTTITGRIARGWSPQDAVTIKVGGFRPKTKK